MLFKSSEKNVSVNQTLTTFYVYLCTNQLIKLQ